MTVAAGVRSLVHRLSGALDRDGVAGCWLLRRALTNGATRLSFGGRAISGARAVYLLVNGPGSLPAGKRLWRTCQGGPLCVQPQHHTLERPRKTTPKPARRRLTPSQVTDIRARRAAGESYTRL